MFSASDLVKRSAMQICYMRKNKVVHKPTPMQLEGVKEQLEKSVTGYEEMRGKYSAPGHIIFYCFDEVDPDNNLLIEHKSVKGEAPDWYFQQSVLQVGYYSSLQLLNPDKKLSTASFFVAQGHEGKELDLKDKTMKSILQFGEEKYEISVLEPEKIVEFYNKKAQATKEYEASKDWDGQFKKQEFNQLNTYFSCQKLK